MKTAALLLCCIAAPLAAQTSPKGIETVSWLQGCWISQSQIRVIEEQWTAPRARVMMGMGRTVRGDSMIEWEVVLIRQRDSSLVYEAHPSGQPTATFTATFASDSSVVFENAMHDFPKKVGYRRIGNDSLLAYIEGPRRGNTLRIEFPYRRARCAELGGPPARPERENPVEQSERGVLSAQARESIVREARTRRAAWLARGIDHYRLRVAVGCFCPWPQTPADIEVRRGTVVALRDTMGRSMGKPREPWSAYTVEKLFDAVEQGAQRSDMISVIYDSTYGFPANIQGNARARLPDGWFWTRATRFTPLR